MSHYLCYHLRQNRYPRRTPLLNLCLSNTGAVLAGQFDRVCLAKCGHATKLWALRHAHICHGLFGRPRKYRKPMQKLCRKMTKWPWKILRKSVNVKRVLLKMHSICHACHNWKSCPVASLWSYTRIVAYSTIKMENEMRMEKMGMRRDIDLG